MAIYPLTDVLMYFGAETIECEVNQASIGVTVAELNSTTFCKQWTEIVGGLQSTTVNFSGFEERVSTLGLAGMAWQRLGANPATTYGLGSVLTVVPNPSSTPAVGDIAYVLNDGRVHSYEEFGEVNGLHEVSLTIGGHKAGRGALLHPYGAETTTGSTTATQIGAIADGQSMYVTMHSVIVSGTSPTMDVIVESDDNSGMTSPTTRATLTQEIARGWEEATIAGPVTDDWWRITYTIGGTTPSFTFVCAAGLEPGS